MNNLKKKIIASIVGFSMVVMLAPGLAQGLTAEELQTQITQLLAQLQTLQNQLATLEGTVAPVAGVTGCAVTSFDRNLKQGMTGDDVKCLQIVLNSDAATKVASSGAGSPGSETSYFGSLTKAAVIKFQEKYASEVLATYGLTTGTGFVGTTTRAKLNSILSADGVLPTGCTCTAWANDKCGGGTCTATQMNQTRTCTPAACAAESQCVADATCVAPTAGLTVALAADTPAAQVVPAGAVSAASNVVFTKVVFTGSGKVSKIVVTRGGVSTDADLTGVKLFDGDTQIGITQTFNAVHQAIFNLTTPWEISGAKTLTIAGDFLSPSTGQIVLSIQSASDITADATVSGTFPIVGNSATGSAVDVGGLTVDNGSLQPVGGGTVDVDATNFLFMQMKLTAGAAEDVYVKAVTIARGVAASFIDSDITNITLYNDTAGTELGKVTALGTNSKTTFSLATPLLIERGRFVEMSVRADILSGSTRNVAFDVNDGVAYTILATGKSYGYGVALAPGTFLGFGPATQINRGILNVSKGANCPATGNIAVGSSDVRLGSFNFKTRGEDIRVGTVIVSLERITVTAGRTAVTDLSLVKLVDSAGNVFAGPVTPTIVGANDAIATFTTSLTLSPGNNEIFVVANTANNAALANCQFRVGFDAAIGGSPGGGVAITNVRGMTSNLPLRAGFELTPAITVVGNVMTAQQGALSADMAATPVAGNIILNSQGLTLANLKLDATASGEDIRITSITLTEVGVGGTLQELSDIELWDSTIQVGLTMQPAAAPATTVTFTLTTPYVVNKGVSKTLAVKANLIAGTAAADTHSFTVAFPVCTTITGAPVGVVPPAGTASPVQLVQNSGALNVTVDASPVTSAQLVAGTTNNEVVRYKFWAFDEDFDVTQVYVCAAQPGGAAGNSPASAAADIASVSLWMGGQQISGNVPVTIGVANAITPSLVGLVSGTLVVPKNGSKVVSLKVNFNEKASLTSDADYQFGICDGTGSDAAWGGAGDYSVIASGRSSGAQIGRIPAGVAVTAIADAAGNVFGGNNMEVFDGKLVIALNSASPSGTQTPGANKEVMRVDLTAVGDDITVTGLTLTTGATYTFNTVSDSVYLQNIAGTVTYDCSLCSAGAGTCAGAGADSFDTGTAIVFPANEVTGPCAVALGWENALVIAEGTTVSIKVVGDTTGVPTVGQSLQLIIVNALTDILWTDNNAVAQGGPGGAGVGTDLVGTQVVPLYSNTLVY